MQSAKIAVSLNVVIPPPPPPPLVVSPASVALPDVEFGKAFGPFTLAKVSGGTPPYHYSFDPNSLPPAGIVLSADADGNPAVAGDGSVPGGSYSFAVDVNDSGQ